jgi:hypothetical protein
MVTSTFGQQVPTDGFNKVIQHIRYIKYRKTRSHIGWGLAFSFLLLACTGNKQEKAIATIIWENDRAVALAIPIAWLEKADMDLESIFETVQVRLEKNSTRMFGAYTRNDTAVIFHPVIPFTRGLHYEIWVNEKLTEEIIIPGLPANEVPRVVGVYPMQDTVPVNILKIHIHFSKPMQEGQASQKLILIKNNRDTVNSAFLELQGELWNKERDMLTVWFDPGRIKRHLQPNMTMGPPLEENTNYLLLIKDWQDTHGASLASEYRWEFVTGARDDTSPALSRWKIKAPPAGDFVPLVIDSDEVLDYVLLTSTIQIVDVSGAAVAGKVVVDKNQKMVLFIPAQEWKPGEYKLSVEARLEDLAGNNLNRLFDNDLSAKQPAVTKDVYTRPFLVNDYNQ